MFEIAGHKIGWGQVFISAELGIAHGGDLDTALKMIDEAAKAQVQGVKIQYYKTSDFCKPSDKTITYKQNMDNPSDDPIYYGELVEKTENEYDFFRRHQIDLDFVKACHKRAREYNLVFGVTTTSAQGVTAIIPRPDYYKVASDMINNERMIEDMEETEVPIIFSTGHLTIEELRKDKGRNDGSLFLHCQSDYPCYRPKLHKIRHMQELGYLTGYSHHGQGIKDCIRAAELGAVFIEAHMCFSHTDPGSDNWWSLDPQELKTLVEAVK